MFQFAAAKNIILKLVTNKFFLIAVAASTITYLFCNAIYEAKVSVLKTEYAQEQERIAKAYQAEIQKAVGKERELRERIELVDKKYYEELQDAKAKNAELRDRIASGDLRLSVATRTTSCSSVSGATETASVDNGEGRTELDPAHAERIIRITEYGDEQIRKLNACQAYVNELLSGLEEYEKNDG